MRQITIKSFTDFIGHTEIFDLVVNLVVFRGQAVEGNLLPSIARNDPTKNPLDRERMMIRQLKLLGAALLPAAEQSALDLLVLAQHFGLETRLLDWTTNPLVALWFACADRAKGDVFVYALEADNHLEEDPYSSEAANLRETKVFQPRFNNPRITAQQGWFTLHRYSSKSSYFVPLERMPKTKESLHEFRIPSQKRKEILGSLDRHGISARTLFPDLEGLCRYLNWKHSEA
ncbi:FRG domain-containing protein [Methylomonas sp. CM2]|uniref:FRG domain-containing protein n=1 Tax=Methylomonas sp. CM2 TaxID=3417647 RepID=UPI003CFA4C67